MRAEEFDQATIEELQKHANQCFDLAKSPLQEPLISWTGVAGDSPVNLDDAGKLRLLLEAQFYVTAVARKKDEQVARRDFKLEIWVIVLIGIEIVLSVVGIGIGLYESNQQAQVLSSVGASTKDTAAAMKDAATSLKTLAEQQTAAVSQLQQMNTALQDSLSKTKAMAAASQKQLGILQTEQGSRLAELAKKPKLALYVENTPANTVIEVHFKPREETDTSSTYNITLVNEGERIATRPLLRVMVNSKGVAVTSTTNLFQQVAEPQDAAVHVFLTAMDNIRPGVRVQMLLTLTYAKAQQPFDVAFSCDADEIQTGTMLGAIHVKPRKPSTQ